MNRAERRALRVHKHRWTTKSGEQYTGIEVCPDCGAIRSGRPCEVHVPGRDRPSPWCAACRLSGGRRRERRPSRSHHTEGHPMSRLNEAAREIRLQAIAHQWIADKYPESAEGKVAEQLRVTADLLDALARASQSGNGIPFGRGVWLEQADALADAVLGADRKDTP